MVALASTNTQTKNPGFAKKTINLKNQKNRLPESASRYVYSGKKNTNLQK